MTYRLQLSFLENPGQDEAAQRHRHDEDEGERQRRRGGLHDPQRHDAPQLGQGEHIHPPCLHLMQQMQGGTKASTRTHAFGPVLWKAVSDTDTDEQKGSKGQRASPVVRLVSM